MMKNTFNAMLKNRPKGQKVNEIYLFRLMARYLNQTAIKCTFCETDSCSILCRVIIQIFYMDSLKELN